MRTRRSLSILAVALMSFAVLSPGAAASKKTQRELLLAKAEKGDVESQFLLAEDYLTTVSSSDGKGNQQPDPANAVKWYGIAAANGHKKAARTLGFFYYTGSYVEKDHAQAATWLERSESGIGYFLLGNMREFDKTPEPDNAAAFAYYVKSGDLGYMPGYYYAASLINKGKVPDMGKEEVARYKEKCLSPRWFKERFYRSADWEMDALKLLVKSYMIGSGVEKDYWKAAQAMGYAQNPEGIPEFANALAEIEKAGYPYGRGVLALQAFDESLSDASILQQTKNQLRAVSAGTKLEKFETLYNAAIDLYNAAAAGGDPKEVDHAVMFIAETEQRMLRLESYGIKSLPENKLTSALKRCHQRLRLAQDANAARLYALKK